MRSIGLNLNASNIEYPEVIRLSETAERLGYDSISLLNERLGGAEARNFEPWMLAVHIVAKTSTIKILVPMPSELVNRPGVVAKMASSLDVLSKGRLIFGIDSGMFGNTGGIRKESGFGLDQLEECIDVIVQLWARGDSGVDYEGRFFKLKNAENIPQPITKPHPPIFVRVRDNQEIDQFLSIASKYADLVCFSGNDLSLEHVNQKISGLQKSLNEIGRNADFVRRALFFDLPRENGVNPIKEGTLEVSKMFQKSEKLGIDYILVQFPDKDQYVMFESLGKTLIASH